MKSYNKISFILAIIINAIILLLIPKINIKKIKNENIKVGLVKFKDNTQKISTTKTTQPKIVSGIKNPVIPNVLSVENFKPAKRYVQIKKKYNTMDIKDIPDTQINIEMMPGSISQIDIKDDIPDEKIDISSSKNVKIDDLKIDTDINLPQGYKLGVEDKGTNAKWESNNKSPIYPIGAELQGLHGKVILKLTVSEDGNVIYVDLYKSSGVPEINRALETVANGWKIYLTKNGMNVKGNVFLEYNFVLK